jgi:hypothetical protein
LKRLSQVSCIKHPSLARKSLENFVQLKRQGQQNRLFILGLVAFDPKLEPSLFEFYLRPRYRQRGR